MGMLKKELNAQPLLGEEEVRQDKKRKLVDINVEQDAPEDAARAEKKRRKKEKQEALAAAEVAGGAELDSVCKPIAIV